jgi:hypothetical protein
MYIFLRISIENYVLETKTLFLCTTSTIRALNFFFTKNKTFPNTSFTFGVCFASLRQGDDILA